MKETQEEYFAHYFFVIFVLKALETCVQLN